MSEHPEVKGFKARMRYSWQTSSAAFRRPWFLVSVTCVWILVLAVKARVHEPLATGCLSVGLAATTVLTSISTAHPRRPKD